MPIISVIPALYFWGLMFEFRGSDISIGFLVTLGISMVITPLIVIMLFDEKGLFQFKIVLGIYLALVTTLSATMFLFMPLIVEKSTEVVFDNSFPVEELTTLLKSTDEEDQKETSELFKNLGIYNDIVDDKGQFLSKEKVIKESKGLLRENVEKVIKIIIEVILLPFLLISVWGSLIIVYRERKPIK